MGQWKCAQRTLGVIILTQQFPSRESGITRAVGQVLTVHLRSQSPEVSAGKQLSKLRAGVLWLSPNNAQQELSVDSEMSCTMDQLLT